MIEDNRDENTTCFLDIDINTFRAVPIVSEKEKILEQISQEAIKCFESIEVWTMYFDGASSKEGARARVVFISPAKNTFRYSFALNFTCTNNVAKYEALLLGLKVQTKHGIKMLDVIRDSKLVISQIRNNYASKNKRLK